MIEILKHIKLLEEFKNAPDYNKIANELDIKEGRSNWFKENHSEIFDSLQLELLIERLTSSKLNNDYNSVIFSLKVCTASKNFAHIDDPQIYQHLLTGEGKEIIIKFKECVVDSLNWIANHDQISLDVKLEFLKSRRRSIGRTALCLSGGGALSMYHLGVIKCMIDQNCLPSVINGTSGGSIVAALVSIHTNDELSNLITPGLSNMHKPFTWFDPVINQIIHFAMNGVLMDYRKFTATVEAFFGRITFEEAFARTKRIVNICVTTSSGGGRTAGLTLLLNHLTTPHVLVSSAVVSSCALPGLMTPVVLLAKGHDGKIQPYMENSKFVDGSLKADIPTVRLAELFNATQFVVSQVNPHVTPFARRVVSQDGALGQLETHLHFDLRQQCKKLAKLKLIPNVFGEPIGDVLKQKYFGDLTIFPYYSLVDSLKAISHPTDNDLVIYIAEGQRACWPHVNRLKSLLKVEEALDSLYKKLRSIKNGKVIDEDDYRPLISEEIEDLNQLIDFSKEENGCIPTSSSNFNTDCTYTQHVYNFKKNGVSIITPPTIVLKRKPSQMQVSSFNYSEAKFGFDINEKTLDELIALKNVLSVKIAEKEALLK